jgi:Putative transposase of IS4/5 family (DUF4096)
MPSARQTEILSLLEVTVTIKETMRGRKKGVACPVQAWHHNAGIEVPAESLSDEAWTSIASLLPRGKGRASVVRPCVDLIFCKGRTGLAWPKLPEPYRPSRSASLYFAQWVADGTWMRVNQPLTDVARVPVGGPDPLPPMRIEGDLWFR